MPCGEPPSPLCPPSLPSSSPGILPRCPRDSALNPAVGAHLADLLKVAEVAAHEEGGGRHEEVQHLPGQDGHVGVLPLQGVQVGHEALGHERQQSPAGREEHDALLRQEAGEDLGDRRGQHRPEAS